MLTCDKLLLGLLLVTPATPLMASVAVSSPANGATVTSPVAFTATATTSTCSKGVASIGIYVDATLFAVVPGTVLNTSLAISPGPHQTVVEEWDQCGGASYSVISITVALPSPTAANPTFSLPAGAYTSAQSVALSDSIPGAKIYYTLNGTPATTSSITYTGPILVSATETINAVAAAPGYAASAMATAPYTITSPAAAPSFSLPGGNYTWQPLVGMADPTPGAVIYYTVDGSTPTTLSHRYIGVIPVTASANINAIAVAPGHSNSPISSAAFTITLATTPPRFSLPSGTYTSVQAAELSSPTPGAAIYYTMDGSVPTTASIRYAAPVPVNNSETVNAVAVAPGYSASSITTAVYTVTLPAAQPTFSIPGGTYNSIQSVALADTTPGATIHYTVNGMQPTVASPIYTGPILVSSTQTIIAMAIAPGSINSHVSVAGYIIKIAAYPPATQPVFSVPGGTYTSNQTVGLSDATPGATIYYTVNGMQPTVASPTYAGPILVSSNQTIMAMAIAPGTSNSPLSVASYIINIAPNPPAALPMFSVPGGTYTSVQSVALSDTTPGATIHYTVNGIQPTVASPIYTGPISVSANQTIMAMATAPGSTNSPLGVASYIINTTTPNTGPEIPADAISATALQVNPYWAFNHDAGTPGSSLGAKANVTYPTISGNTGEFSSSYANWGGEIYHLSYDIDSAATNFVYDAQVWIAQGSQLGNLEMDMNQVIPDGDTVIFGFQCDGDNGTWDYSANVGAIRTSKISWIQSSAPCDPGTWTTDTWHHVQISYSRDDAGYVTYNSVWLDGVETVIGATVPSARTLGWPVGHLLTNFQVDGLATTAASVLYMDNLTISRW